MRSRVLRSKVMMPLFRLPLFIFFFSSLLDFGHIGLVIMIICSSSFDNDFAFICR